MHFSTEEVGAYIRLLCHQWMNGFIPEETDKQTRICGCQCDRIATVLEKFQKGEDGKLRNERMETVRSEQQAFLARKTAAGQAGAAARWQPHSERNADALPGQCAGNASLNSELLTPFNSSVAKSASAKRKLKPVLGESEFIEELKDTVGSKAMVNWGGKWRNHFRENQDKAKRLLWDLKERLKGGEIHSNAIGYMNKMWKVFV